MARMRDTVAIRIIPEEDGGGYAVYGPFGPANWDEEADKWVEAMEIMGLKGKWYITPLEAPHAVLATGVVSTFNHELVEELKKRRA